MSSTLLQSPQHRTFQRVAPASSAPTDRADAAFQAARFRGDVDRLAAIQRDEVITRQLRRTEILRRRSTLRARLLSNAVRVNVSLIPNVARSFELMRARLGGCLPVEAYVFSDASITAFVTQTGERYLIAVSSGAIGLLTAEELEFVIGHELGHALYGHLDVPAGAVLELAPLEVTQQMQLRAWQRASEISADRAGLLLCGSLEVAATALFKTLAGIALPGLTIDPHEFAQQWDGLVEEVLDHGLRGQWQLSHPFPPLRMRALIAFWHHHSASDSAEASAEASAEVDAEVAQLLAHMDPTAATDSGGHDPLLSRFSLWGGLYVALADGTLDADAIERFQRMAPRDTDLAALASAPAALPALCLQRFRDARETRREKLSSAELHRIVTGLVAEAARAGDVTRRARQHLNELGDLLGLGPAAIELFVSKRLTQE